MTQLKPQGFTLDRAWCYLWHRRRSWVLVPRKSPITVKCCSICARYWAYFAHPRGSARTWRSIYDYEEHLDD